MSDQGIFSQPDQGTSKSTETPSKSGDTATTLELLVGEGRKYKTQEDLVKAHLHLDEFAETLKGENAQLRADLAKAKTFDEVLERLKAEPRSGTQDQGAKKVEGQPSGLTTTDVAAIVRDAITGHETAKTRDANLARADAEMKKLFGEKAKEVFDKEASSPQMRKALVELAGVSPEKFVAIFRPAQAGGGQVDGATSVNTSAMSDVNASGRALDPGCKEFYDNLRRTKPKDYYSQPIQLQMNRNAVANPNKFFGSKST